MGCDIHTYVEVCESGEWRLAVDLDREDVRNALCNRDYGMFGFLADVRNFSHSPVISEPRGLPTDVSVGVRGEYQDWGEWHDASWLLLAELRAYDYDRIFWDRRVTRNGNGAALAEEGEGKHLSVRDFLGQHFFTALDDLAELGDPEDVRIVFWFDN